VLVLVLVLVLVGLVTAPLISDAGVVVAEVVLLWAALGS